MNGRTGLRDDDPRPLTVECGECQRLAEAQLAVLSSLPAYRRLLADPKAVHHFPAPGPLATEGGGVDGR